MAPLPDPVYWFVIAQEPGEADFVTEVFGPFNSETDARAYAMDVADDNGWLEVEAREMTLKEASLLATDGVRYPYKE